VTDQPSRAVDFDNTRLHHAARAMMVPIRELESLVAIYRLMREAAFDQDEIDRLSAAYEGALRVLQLRDRNDSITELIAAKIIEIARQGERDAAAICDRAIQELGISAQK
jgi:hypothetical protein